MEKSPELVRLVSDWFAAASRGDPALIERHVSTSRSARLVGSDPDEWLHGGDAIATFLRGEVTGAGGDVTFTPSETEAFASGDVGWAATKLTIAMPDGRKITPRWTAVLEREGEEWRFVQTHASIAVANDAVRWTYE
jgi:ketosteroid isomerase-like protein